MFFHFYKKHKICITRWAGRARREAARRRKSEWKVNVAIPNSSRSNGSWRVTPKTVSLSIVEPRGIWTCVSLQCTSTSNGSICAL